MIRRIVVKDVFAVNCYFYIDDETRHGFLIDPGAQASRILQKIAENGWTIERILLTHGHFDHTGAVSEIAQTLGIPYCIHRAGEKYLTDTRWNLSAYCGRNVYLDGAEYFDDGDVIRLEPNPSFALKSSTLLDIPLTASSSIVSKIKLLLSVTPSFATVLAPRNISVETRCNFTIAS